MFTIAKSCSHRWWSAALHWNWEVSEILYHTILLSSNSRLPSTLQCFAFEMKGTSMSIMSRLLWREKRIKTQESATWKRKFGTKGMPGSTSTRTENRSHLAWKKASCYIFPIQRRNHASATKDPIHCLQTFSWIDKMMENGSNYHVANHITDIQYLASYIAR